MRESLKKRKIILVIFTAVILMFALSVFLFYTRYALPNDNNLDLTGHKILFSEGYKLYEGSWEDKKIIKKEIFRGSNIEEIDEFVNNYMKVNFRIDTSMEMKLTSLLSEEDRSIFNFPEPLNCIITMFILDPGICIGWNEDELYLETKSIRKLLLHVGDFKMLMSKKYNYTWGEPFLSDTFLTLKLIKSNNPFTTNGSVYIFVYKIPEDKWTNIFKYTRTNSSNDDIKVYAIE